MPAPEKSKPLTESDVADALFQNGARGERVWRQYLCACCHRVDQYITNPTSRRAIEQAQKFIDGRITLNDLFEWHREAELATNASWKIVLTYKLPDSWLWPLSDEVDNAWVRFLACAAADATVQPELRPSLLPDAAAGVPAWAFARPNVRTQGINVDSESAREVVQMEWDRLNEAQRDSQVQLLLELADSVL